MTNVARSEPSQVSQKRKRLQQLFSFSSAFEASAFLQLLRLVLLLGACRIGEPTAPKAMQTIRAELTDTMGGEANYSWARRAELQLPDDASDLAIVRAAKAALGLSGVRCRREQWGETIALYPYGSATVAFIG